MIRIALIGSSLVAFGLILRKQYLQQSKHHDEKKKTPITVSQIKDLVYLDDPIDKTKQSLDLYLPSIPRKSSPLLVFIHGGLWTGRDKSAYSNIGQTFAQKGITTAVINYRLSGGKEDPKVLHPDHTRDCAAAFQWLLKNDKRFGYDSKNIFVMGHSCGAHMAGLLAVRQDQYLLSYQAPVPFLGCIGIAGLYDTRLFVRDFPQFRGEVELSMTSDESKWDSPTDYPIPVFKSYPSWLILHSPEDQYLNSLQPQTWKSHLATRATMHLNLTGNHFDLVNWVGDPHQDQITPLVIDFITNTLP